MTTAIRQATTVTSQAMRPRFTVVSSTSMGVFWPPARMAAARGPAGGAGRTPANCGKMGALHVFPPRTRTEWDCVRFREGHGCPQTVLASVFPTKVEGGASDQI